MTTQTNDPYTAAMAAEPRKPIYWGNLMAEAFFCVLEKGIGKVPFDPQSHPPERKLTAVNMSLLTITEQNIQNPIERSVVAEFSEWGKFVLPSLQELGVVELRDLNDRYVKLEIIKTGQKYEVKDDTGKKTGEMRDSTTFRFLKLFANEQECAADYLSGDEPVDGPEPNDIVEPVPAPTQAEAQPQAGNGGNGSEKKTAQIFLGVLVSNAVNGQTDLKVVQDTLAASLENAPLVSKYFNVDSPETLELIMKEMGKNA